VAIVTLVLWALTAAAGITMLRAGGAARRTEADRPDEAPSAAQAGVPAAKSALATAPGSVSASASASARQAPRMAAIPLTPEGLPPPVPHARVTTRPGEHPLLEFAHPALAVTGMACWFMYTFVHYRPLAWIAFGILVVALGVGLGWALRNNHEVRNHARFAWHFPPRLLALHGLAAAVSITLTVLTALIASHG
jgi:hypothetical protein